jgi:hypothetical protein
VIRLPRLRWADAEEGGLLTAFSATPPPLSCSSSVCSSVLDLDGVETGGQAGDAQLAGGLDVDDLTGRLVGLKRCASQVCLKKSVSQETVDEVLAPWLTDFLRRLEVVDEEVSQEVMVEGVGQKVVVEGVGQEVVDEEFSLEVFGGYGKLRRWKSIDCLCDLDCVESVEYMKEMDLNRRM